MTGVCRAVHVVVLLGIITSIHITASHETKLVGEKTDACVVPSSSPLSVFIALKAVSFISRLLYTCLYMTYIDKYTMLYIFFYPDDSLTYVYHKNC